MTASFGIRHDELRKYEPDSPENKMLRQAKERETAAIVIRECTGYLVTWEAAKGYYKHYYAEDLSEAIDAYDEPPMGWTGIGISAAKDGVPYCRLEASVIMAVRGERRS